MTDTLTAKRRSELMGRIRGKDTGPELALAKLMRALRVHHEPQDKDLPGRPDFTVYPVNGPRLAVFVHGCFWHGCPAHYKAPKSRAAAWVRKVAANRKRDVRARRELRRMGYDVSTIWEHDLPRKAKGRKLEA